MEVRKMKKIIAFSLTLCLSLCFMADCGGTE